MFLLSPSNLNCRVSRRDSGSCLENHMSLKGQCHEIFCFRFFSWISFPPAPEYPIRTVSNFFENPRRYTQVKVHHRYQGNCRLYQRHRRQIGHLYQRHRLQILPLSFASVVDVANFNDTGSKFAADVNDTGGK